MTGPDRLHTKREGGWIDLAVVAARSPEGVVTGALQTSAAQCGDEASWMAALVTAAAHDLRQPLQVIGLALDRLAPRAIDGRAAAILQAARGEVQALSAGLADLAATAHLGVGGPRQVETPLRAVLESAVTSCRPMASLCESEIRLIDTSLRVRSDPQGLSIILRNLVGNAVKYGGGQVLVGCRRTAQGIRLDVVDRGPGIAPAALQCCGDVPAARPDMSGGLGLGLAIVREGARRLGCRLEIASTPGRGTRISLLLPRCAVA